MVAKTSVPFLGAFIRCEKRHANLLTRENLCHQGRHAHVSRIERQVEGLIASVLSARA
jgi:hypothetical protein